MLEGSSVAAEQSGIMRGLWSAAAAELKHINAWLKKPHPRQPCLTASGLLPRRCQRPGLITAKQCSVAQALLRRRQAAASKLGLLPWRCQRPGLRWLYFGDVAAAAELKNVWLNRPHARQFCLTASELGLLPWRCQRPGLRSLRRIAQALFRRRRSL